MKKTIILLASLILISVLGWYSYHLMNTSGVSNTELVSFNIEDVKSVNKIIVSDQFGKSMTVVKNGNEWTDKDGGCIQQEGIGFMLDAIKNIEFKGYLPENSRDNQIKMMSTKHIKVEIFQNGEWSKTWYIGSATQDHYGQVMLLDSKESGKSDLPVIMKLKGLNGIIEPRFFADSKKWICTKIFSLPISQISKVDVKNMEEPALSFSVIKKGAKLDVLQQGVQLQKVDTSMIFRYLQNFKKIHFENANYELNKKQIDSLKKSKPFVVLTLTETSNKQTKLRMFRIKAKQGSENEFGVLTDSDLNKFWCELPNGEIVKCQYFVFNPIIAGHIYFPMNLNSIKKGKGY